MANGEAEDVIDIMSKWPRGKHEDEAWGDCSRFAKRIFDLSRKQKGGELIAPIDSQSDPGSILAMGWSATLSPKRSWRRCPLARCPWSPAAN